MVAAEPSGENMEVQRLRRLFRFFAAAQCRGRSPVYEALSNGVAADTDLPHLLMSAPAEQRRPSRRPVDAQLMPALVFTATLLSYLTASARTAFAAQLRQAAERRPVAWVFGEAPGLVATAAPALAALAGPVAQRNSLFLVGASMLGPGHRDDALLALTDPYLRWIAPARHNTDDFHWLTASTDAG